MPDLLHSMLIGMLDHLQKRTFQFMKTHERLDKYSVSNRSEFPGLFRVRFHPNPDCGNGSYHMKNPDHWKWAWFTTKNPGFQVHIFGSS